MSNNTNTITADPNCAYCEGTGEDLDFGGKCSSCNGGTEAPKETKPASVDEQAELAIWLSEQTWSDFAQSLARFFNSKGYLSEKQMKAGSSMRAKCEARQASQTKVAPVEPSKAVKAPGMFMKDGEVYKVQQSRTSGNLYAKRLEGTTFEYAAGAIRKLSEDDRMTLEQAQAYGKATGTCCVCGRELTNEGSIEAGIGPICATKF